MLLAILSAYLLANLPIPAPVLRVALVTLWAVAVLSLFVGLTQVLFNWPRFLAPKTKRTQPGAVGEWLRWARKHTGR